MILWWGGNIWLFIMNYMIMNGWKRLFDERHSWILIYIRDTFWAGQLNNEMKVWTHFFYGYLNSKTTLKQFVKQYDNILKDKIEKESMANFRSFNTIIAYVSHFSFWIPIPRRIYQCKVQLIPIRNCFDDVLSCMF